MNRLPELPQTPPHDCDDEGHDWIPCGFRDGITFWKCRQCGARDSD